MTSPRLFARRATTTAMSSMAASPAASLGFLFLTSNSIIVAIRKSRGGDAAAVSFVVVSYLTLLLLFYCLRWFETAHPGSASRDRARVGVWLTTTLLTALFTWRVAALMPWPVAAGVCFMGGSTVAGGFNALFLLPRAAKDSELMVENIQ